MSTGLRCVRMNSMSFLMIPFGLYSLYGAGLGDRYMTFYRDDPSEDLENSLIGTRKGVNSDC